MTTCEKMEDTQLLAGLAGLRAPSGRRDDVALPCPGKSFPLVSLPDLWPRASRQLVGCRDTTSLKARNAHVFRTSHLLCTTP